jgi:CheY-like chemotaxis protein
MLGQKLKIVVVDDEKSVLDTAKTVLESFGHNVVVFGDGFGAVTFCSQDTCDLIFIDIAMPNMDGLSTIEQIKKLNPNVRTIIMSGYYAEIGKDCADLYLPKPLTYQNLKEAIKIVMSKKKGGEVNDR